MSIGKFLKDKWLFLILQSIIILFIATFLTVLRLNTYGVLFVTIGLIVISGIMLAGEYSQKYVYYQKLIKAMERLDKKHLISELIEEPSFQEGKLWWEVLGQAIKSMNDEIATYRISQEEYKTYIETWVHEIKTPLAAMELMCEVEKTNMTQAVLKETKKVEAYVEQALFYARSTSVEKDYIVKEVNLEEVVKKSAKKYARQLIESKATLHFEHLEYNVLADAKWVDFILSQLISNSIKYRKENLSLYWYAEETSNQVILHMEDNGVGIGTRDIGRVFDKGFTGENGRRYGKSTGIGLYLCKKLCDKMHLGIKLESTVDVGTKVILTFPKDKKVFLEE
ncbi:MAG: sensor histidine kinase [Cellulosilyticaceae bacterium]